MINKADSQSQGYFQMRKIYIADVNKICGYKRFNDTDRFDYTKSVKMFFIFNNHYIKNWDYRTVAIVHACGLSVLDTINKKFKYGRGEDYWEAIQKILNKPDNERCKILYTYKGKK